VEPLSEQELLVSNNRYDAQVSTFGQTMQKRLEDARVFVIGVGALGCKFLRNLALLKSCLCQQGEVDH
jgi:ubiquitin-activating enzyme E1